MSDVFTIERVLMEVKGYSPLYWRKCQHGRLDPRTALFGPGGLENIILNIGTGAVDELHSINHVTRSMAQGDLAAMEQHFRLAM